MTGQGFRVFSFRRWSKASQTDGDSDRRQLEAALSYCQRMGWALDEQIVDPGRSGFRGSHLRQGGSLARFFRQVESGVIRSGDKLIFEGFDRFSRQSPDIALPLFLDLIKAGIEIHTTFDGSIYNKRTIRTNQGQLYSTLSYMWAAHTESANKSKRVREAWKRRRTEKTLVCPAWVKPNSERTAYELVPEHVAVIERICRWAIAGHGVEWIAKSLNREGVPAFGRHVLAGTKAKRKPSDGWHHSYVRTLLTDRRVIGEAEFAEWHTGDEGEVQRIRTGIRRKIYPAAVDEKLFQQVQDTRRRDRQGRNGSTMANLFGAKLAKCSCGSVMTLVRKGTKSTYTYIQCNDARRNQKSCTNRKLHRYEPIELFVLKFFGQLAYGDIRPDETTAGLRSEMAKAKQAADDIETRFTRLAEAVEGGAGGLASKRLALIEADHKTALARVDALEKQIQGLASAPIGDQLAEVQKLIRDMDTIGGDERVALRSRLNRGLGAFVDCIVFNDPAPPAGALCLPEIADSRDWYVKFKTHFQLPIGDEMANLVRIAAGFQHGTASVRRRKGKVEITVPAG